MEAEKTFLLLKVQFQMFKIFLQISFKCAMVKKLLLWMSSLLKKLFFLFQIKTQ